MIKNTGIQREKEGMQSLLYHCGQKQLIHTCQLLEVTTSRGFLGVIFDCDGTLVRSGHAHFCAMQSAAREQNAEMSWDWYHARTGLDRAKLFQEFAQFTNVPFDERRACELSLERFKEFAHLIEPVRCTTEYARVLKQQQIQVAVATNAEHSTAQLSLEVGGVRGVFPVIVSVSDGLPPKPKPDLFLTAASRLGLTPDKVLVIEDSDQGVEAAISAEMSVVQILEC